jgi:hypothetical protein
MIFAGPHAITQEGSAEFVGQLMAAGNLAGMALYWGARLLTAVAGLLGSLAIMAFLIEFLQGEKMSVGQSYAQGARCFGRALGAYLLLFVAFVGAGIMLARLAGFLTSNGGVCALLLMPLLLGLLYVMIRVMTVFGVVVVAEKAGGWNVMRQSWALTKGNFWRITGVLLISILLGGGLVLLAFLSIGGVTIAVRAAGMDPIWPTVLTGLLFDLAVALLVVPFSTTVTVMLYFDLLARRRPAAPASYGYVSPTP